MSIIGFPLLLIPLAVCNIVIFMMPGVAFDAPLATARAVVRHRVVADDRRLLVSLGALLLLLEVIKAGRPGAKYVTDHLLSLLVFAAAIAEFVMLPQFGISTVFLLAMLALVDFLAGIALRHRGARAAPRSPRSARRTKPRPPDADRSRVGRQSCRTGKSAASARADGCQPSAATRRRSHPPSCSPPPDAEPRRTAPTPLTRFKTEVRSAARRSGGVAAGAICGALVGRERIGRGGATQRPGLRQSARRSQSVG